MRLAVIVSVVIFTFAVGVGGGIYVIRHTVNLDENMCPKDGLPKMVTAVLIDATDPISPDQKKLINDALGNVRKNVPSGGTFEIYRVDDVNNAQENLVFRKCSPGGPTDGVVFFLERWEKEFIEQSTAAFRESLNYPEGSGSPIIASIQYVADQSFAKNELFSNNPLDDVRKKLVIISDMIENTIAMNHYKKVPAYEDYKASQESRVTAGYLAGVEVKIFYLLVDRRFRRDAPQEEEHMHFWMDYFADHGANLETPMELIPY